MNIRKRFNKPFQHYLLVGMWGVIYLGMGIIGFGYPLLKALIKEIFKWVNF